MCFCCYFGGDLDVDTLIKQISLRIPNSKLVPNETLIFLDEIQNCPNARTSLKFFTMDKRFDVIASGSLLGINYKAVPSYPVGYVEHLEMHSLDFEEFLWANGISNESILDIKEYYKKREKVPIAMHERMLELFKDYKKFRYGYVEPRATAKKYQGSLMWLYDAGIINFCYNLTNPELPLEGNARSDIFKVYMRDTGLLMAMLEDGSQEDIIDGNLGIYKGAIYENIIADIFTKSGKKLYYFEHNSKIELDFIIRYNKVATVVEVKSANNTKSKSMISAIENWNVKHGIKLSTKNVGGTDEVDSLPLYMAMFL